MNVTINVYINECGCKPQPPMNLKLTFERIPNMSQSIVTATWTPSVSPDVTSQTLTWTLDGVAQSPIVFHDNTTATANITVDDGTVVDGDLFCTNPQGDSSHATGTITPPIPPGPPAPPTDFTLTSTPV